MAEEEKTSGGKNFLSRLLEQAKKKPAISGGIALGAILVIVVIYKNKTSASTTSTSGSTGSSSLNGFDIASMAGIPYAEETGPLPGGTSTSATNGSTSTATTIQIRDKSPVDSSSSTQTSIPLHGTIGGSSVGSIPFGSSVTLISGPTSGTNNTSRNKQFSSNQWYQVSYNGMTGYVNGVDVSKSSGGVGGGKILFNFDHFLDAYSENGFNHV